MEPKEAFFPTLVSWYKMAATCNFHQAQHNLAFCYLMGLGTPPNPIEAYIWFHIAGDSTSTGQEYVKANCSLIERDLSAEDLNFAKNRIRIIKSQLS